MQIIHHMTIDMAKPLPVVPVSAVQGDGNTRAVKTSLLESGAPWEVPAGVTAAVAFRKADGHKGLYDTLPDGTKAVTIDGSTVTAVLAPQVLRCAGMVSASVVFYDANLQQLATFPFTIRVEKNPAAGQEKSNDYYRFSTMEQVSEAVDGFLQAAQKALETVHDTATEDAPAIVCEAIGEVIHVADAAEHPLKGLTLYGKTTQSGAPTPGNPVPLKSVGAGGSIGATVAGNSEAQQSLHVSTPNGLPGIPVSSGGNYTDESGQQWLCDEIDFARGVYVRRMKTFTPKDVSSGYANAHGNSYVAILCTDVMDFDNVSVNPVMCDSLPNETPNNQYTSNKSCIACGAGRVMVTIKDITNSAGVKQWLLDNPIVIQYPIATPIETPLSAVELAQYAALHTNKPNTTVFNDSGAGMKLSYVADTKTYIDQKLAAISAAMLNN